MGDGMLITKRSIISGKEHTRFVKNLTEAMLEKYQAGALAQDAFYGVSADDREFLMTGITPEEWDAAFPEEDEEDDDDI